jgi:hypothetical protein
MLCKTCSTGHHNGTDMAIYFYSQLPILHLPEFTINDVVKLLLSLFSQFVLIAVLVLTPDPKILQ